MKVKIKVGFGNKKFNIEARKLSSSEIFRGLMFKTRESENLLFDKSGSWAIHSFFVFFPFLALWLDEENKIVEHRIVKPFSFHIKPEKKFARLIEIPINERNKLLVDNFIR